MLFESGHSRIQVRQAKSTVIELTTIPLDWQMLGCREAFSFVAGEKTTAPGNVTFPDAVNQKFSQLIRRSRTQETSTSLVAMLLSNPVSSLTWKPMIRGPAVA